MKRDGTPFDVTSVLEEDIIEICIKLGHTHPMGVFHYSVTESIILFQLADDTQCTTFGAIKAMVLCEEAIAIRASAPSETHVRAYMTAVAGEPSRTQPPPLEGEGSLICLLETPIQVGKLHHLPEDLDNLADHKLCQLMEDLHWEVTLCELNAPPEVLHQHLGETQQGGGIPIKMTKRLLFQKGRVGFPQDNHSNCLPP